MPGDWLTTYTGQRVSFIEPHPDTINIEDIAHGLSHICRYVGHTPRFYSVAEHCLIMLEMGMHGFQQLTLSPLCLLHILMHDASEAYLGDVSRHLKIAIPTYREYEARMMRTIFSHFAIPLPDEQIAHQVKCIDECMFMYEKKIFFPNVDWGDGYNKFPIFERAPLRLKLPSMDTKKVFIREFNRLHALIQV